MCVILFVYIACNDVFIVYEWKSVSACVYGDNSSYTMVSCTERLKKGMSILYFPKFHFLFKRESHLFWNASPSLAGPSQAGSLGACGGSSPSSSSPPTRPTSRPSSQSKGWLRPSSPWMTSLDRRRSSTAPSTAALPRSSSRWVFSRVDPFGSSYPEPFCMTSSKTFLETL